jgi:eukaryotic-like serine/threonine-protein kinase
LFQIFPVISGLELLRNMGLEMDSERFRQVEELFLCALPLESVSRQAFLDRECGKDAELRHEVESLLAHRTQAAGFLEPTGRDVTETMPTGQQFGSYRILSPLGAGGMGEVYRAHDSKLGRDVAIKTLPREFADDPERLARFRREARTLAALNHPNIAAIYGLEEFQSATCLVLELVEGKPLHGPLPIPKVLNFARQIAEGLEAAHEKGIVHRDLKPANVKVTPQGRVKILDFGLAKAVWGSNDAADLSQLSAPVGSETLAGHVVGSPPYMSPEQARGGNVDTRTDIWAFGCVLFELLTGKRAFRGDTLETTIQGILESEPEWSALPTTTPPGIITILKQCLQKDPKLRLQVVKDARTAIENVQRGRNPWPFAAVVAAALALLVTSVALWLRSPAPVSRRDQWVQLTNLPDSVSQPALSPDGRMLVFVRGPSTFYGPGQIYVKMLPDGAPKQLTNDDHKKMGPVFSPDGSRIAYTTVDQFLWDTWTVPVSGGEPRRWLEKASGLIWKDTRTVLFSELLVGNHMAVRASEEGRSGGQFVYTPAHKTGMAHRTYPSPDGQSALIVEMDGPWPPCRLVPLDGSSLGRSVGPPGAACTFAAWSPDGKWMYFSSSAGGSFHTWRQAFPAGSPERITSGPSEEEGIAMAADGHSFVTSVGQRQRYVSLHTAGGDRQISLEGYAYNPKFTPDFKMLCYRILKGSQPSSDPSELWLADLESDRRELLLPGFDLVGMQPYAISRDGREVLFSARNSSGTDQLWLAPLDRSSPPHQVPDAEGNWPVFDPRGGFYFRGNDGFAYHMQLDGSGRQRVLPQPVMKFTGLSPDGKWLAVWSFDPNSAAKGGREQADLVYPVSGGAPIRMSGGDSMLRWSPDGRFLFIGAGGAGMGGGFGRSYGFPLARGKMLPEPPLGGFRAEAEMATYPGVQVIEASDVALGPTPDVYASSKETTQRNLFRIPLH